MKKEAYIPPVMEVCEFETEDVITTSGVLMNGGIGGDPTEIEYDDLF